MKKKDIIYLSITLAIMVFAGFLLLGGGSKSKQGPTVEIIEPIEGTYDQTILSDLEDPQKNRNFAVKVNLKTELGNPRPFGN